MDFAAVANVIAAGAIRTPARCEILGLGPFLELAADVAAEVLRHGNLSNGTIFPFVTS
jgi:hypothetical protein